MAHSVVNLTSERQTSTAPVVRRYNGAHTGEEESPCVLKHAPPSQILTKWRARPNWCTGRLSTCRQQGKTRVLPEEKCLRISASTPDTGGRVGSANAGGRVGAADQAGDDDVADPARVRDRRLVGYLADMDAGARHRWLSGPSSIASSPARRNGARAPAPCKIAPLDV